MSEQITKVYGDIYCKGFIAGWGNVYGDAYAKNSISSVNVTGCETENVPNDEPPVTMPALSVDDFTNTYRIGSTVYSVTEYTSDAMDAITIGPTAGNPAGVYYHNGNLDIYDDVIINGTLAVRGDLKIRGTGNTITAQKNFPAVIIDAKLKPYSNSELTIWGLAYVKNEVEGDNNPVGASLTVIGALFIKDRNIDRMGNSSNSITIRAYADKAAYKLWADASSYTKWSPAVGAVFTSITRVP